ncbi:DPP IV N-terminal domain-containing protein [Myroides sp. DF42-4-2]|uniref:S9 family peptidase n=1 Tax=Myroides sp. DF42-4-2 TaxID=2746726 RepID=UPI0025751BDF|nr:DPP IV N-terminal domain-containing protein [Myroides sp. DF42-4-2]MDM1408667.1 DPP IV N-terminal domain-containing protein [Myroides sp. DF42-4-2]
MKKIQLLALAFLTGNLLFAQRNLTMQEATLGQYTSFAPERLTQPSWKDAQAFTHLNAKRDSLFIRTQAVNWTPSFLFSVAHLQAALTSSISEASFQLTSFPSDLAWKNENTLTFSVLDTARKFRWLFHYNTQDQQVSLIHKIPVHGQEYSLSRNKEYVAWLTDNNIEIADKKGQITAVTQDTDAAIVNGSSNTHRNEFGINKGMWWSPKQEQLLYYRNDQSQVTDYPLVQWDPRVAENKNIKYPMAGMENERVSLVIYDVYTQNKITLATGDQDQFLTMVTWDPSGNYVYVGVLNREQNHLKLNKYNAATGALEATLFEEKSTTYTEPSQGLVFNPEDNKSFVYLSEKDGYRQMYLYSTTGKLIKTLGHESVIVSDLIGFDAEGKNIYYTGVTNQGLDRQVFKVNLKKGKTEQLTSRSGTHEALFNTDKSLFLDSFNSYDVPNRVSLVQTSNQKEVEILQAKDPYQGVITMPKTEILSLTAADGKTPLNARMIYPTNFDATKTYPVMVYVYGGPHAQLITNTWLEGSSLFFHYMAQQGYIVFTVDNRGSFNRGKDFEHVIHRQLGQNEMADQMVGVKYLQTLPYVDQSKIGVYGWSYGGFMTTSLSVNYPSVFKVGVAGGPVMDWKMYEIMYGERYMDTPKENPEGYERTSLLNKASKLDNKLLLIHGAQDPVVVQQHSMLFIEACIKANKQVDYFLYPNHEHNVRGLDRVHLNTKIAQYFFDHLAKPRP